MSTFPLPHRNNINNTTYDHIHQPTCATTHVPSRHQHNPLCIHHLLHNLIVQILTLLAEQLIDMRERERRYNTASVRM